MDKKMSIQTAMAKAQSDTEIIPGMWVGYVGQDYFEVEVCGLDIRVDSAGFITAQDGQYIGGAGTLGDVEKVVRAYSQPALEYGEHIVTNPETGEITVYTLVEAMVEGGAIVHEEHFASQAELDARDAEADAYADGYDAAQREYYASHEIRVDE